MAFLDNAGLTYLWGKIKSYAVAKNSIPIRIGTGGSKPGNNSVQIGVSVEASGYDSLAIGGAASCFAYNSSTALGTHVSVIYDLGLGIGSNIISRGTQAIAIGSFTDVNESSSIGIGMGVNIESGSYNGIGIGSGVRIKSTYSIALGSCVITNNFRTILIGSFSEANKESSIGIGCGVKLTKNSQYSIAIGESAAITCQNTVAIGNNARCKDLAEQSVAIGKNINISGSHSVAIGSDTNAGASGTVAIGSMSRCWNNYGLALGYNANSAYPNTWQFGDTGLAKIQSRVGISTTSDERDKKVIGPITSNTTEFLSKIHAIRYYDNNRKLYLPDDEHKTEEDKQNEEKYGIYDYDHKAHEEGTLKGERVRVGVLAQEVVKAMQEVYGDDSYGNIVDDNWHDYTPEQLSKLPSFAENELTINYSNFIPFLIKSIQELDERITRLEEKVSYA